MGLQLNLPNTSYPETISDHMTSPLLLTRMERRNTDLTLSNIYCKETLLRTTCAVP